MSTSNSQTWPQINSSSCFLLIWTIPFQMTNFLTIKIFSFLPQLFPLFFTQPVRRSGKPLIVFLIGVIVTPLVRSFVFISRYRSRGGRGRPGLHFSFHISLCFSHLSNPTLHCPRYLHQNWIAFIPRCQQLILQVLIHAFLKLLKFHYL